MQAMKRLSVDFLWVYRLAKHNKNFASRSLAAFMGSDALVLGAGLHCRAVDTATQGAREFTTSLRSSFGQSDTNTSSPQIEEEAASRAPKNTPVRALCHGVPWNRNRFPRRSMQRFISAKGFGGTPGGGEVATGSGAPFDETQSDSMLRGSSGREAESRVIAGLPQERMPPELRDFDWSSKEGRKSLVERLLRGNLDLFRGPSYLDTSVPRKEMELWQQDFRMKVVDVNRTSRGSPTGGIGRFSALVVVGNSKGTIGLGAGKSLAMSEAIKKANRQALKTLFYVPRYKQATILHPVVARYGKCKVIMYPRSTGSGCKASNMVSGICQLVGIQDIGVKIHGTRNVRNMVKALIRGFESQVVEEELRDIPGTPAVDRTSQFLLKSRKGAPSITAIG